MGSKVVESIIFKIGKKYNNLSPHVTPNTTFHTNWPSNYTYNGQFSVTMYLVVSINHKECASLHQLFSRLAPKRYELQLGGLMQGRVSDNKGNDWHPLSLHIQTVFRGAYREQTYQTFVYLAGDNLRFKEHTSGLIFHRISGNPSSKITHFRDISTFLKQNIVPVSSK